MSSAIEELSAIELTSNESLAEFARVYKRLILELATCIEFAAEELDANLRTIPSNSEDSPARRALRVSSQLQQVKHELGYSVKDMIKTINAFNNEFAEELEAARGPETVKKFDIS